MSHTIPGWVRTALKKRANSDIHDPGDNCERCGRSGANNAHHRRNLSQGGCDDLSNLFLLDGSGNTGCHGWVTENPYFATRLGYTVQGTEQRSQDVPVFRRGRWVLLGDDGSVTELSRLDDRVLALQADVVAPVRSGGWGETPAWGDDDWRVSKVTF